MKSLRARAVVYGLVIVLGLLSALPNVLPRDLSGRLPDWYLDNTVSLGLDLQGGSHLLLQADIEELFTSVGRLPRISAMPCGRRVSAMAVCT